jgi:hypothetical protein
MNKGILAAILPRPWRRDSLVSLTLKAGWFPTNV